MDAQELSSNIKELETILKSLSLDQLRYVSVRPYVQFDKEAADEIGVRPETVSRWKNKSDVERAVRLMALDGVATAREMRRRALTKAMRVKIDGLEEKDDKRLKQSVATEIIEWEMGKATQPTSISGEVTTRRGEPNFDSWDDTELDAFIRLVGKAVKESESGESSQETD